MPPRSTLATLAALLLILGVSASAQATSLSVLTYNTQGLPGTDLATRGPLIAAQLDAFRASQTNSIVHLQETFVGTFYTDVTNTGYANITEKTT